MKTCAGIITVVVCLFLASASLPAAAAEPASIPLPPPAIDRQAGIMLTNLKNGRIDTAEDALRQLIAMRREANIANLTPIASAFIGYFDSGTSGATPKKRRQLLELATELAPDYPGIWFKLAKVRLFQGVSNFGPAAGLFISGFKKMAGFPRSESVMLAETSFYLIGVLLILYLIAGAGLLMRYLPQMRHDIGDIFPNAESTHFTAAEIRKSRGFLQQFSRMLSGSLLTILIIVIISAPFILGAGLLVTAAVWMFLVFPYARTTERATVIVTTVIAAVLPWAGSFTALPGHVSDSPGTHRWTCLREYCPEIYQRSLEQLIFDEAADARFDKSKQELTVAAVAAGKLQFSGAAPMRLANAHVFLEQHKDSLVSSVGQVLMGNAILLDALAQCPGGKLDPAAAGSAMGWYGRALTDNPNDEAANRGLAVASGLAGDRKGMEESLQRVLDITKEQDLDFMAQVRTLTASGEPCAHIPEIMAELRPPRPPSDFGLYYDDVPPLKLLDETPPLLPFKTVLMGGVSPRMLPAILGGLILFGIALIFVNPRHKRAYRCPTCGHVICPSCNKRASGFEHCPICLFDQVRPAFLDPKDVNAMTAFQHKGLARRYWIPVMSIAVPGSGQFLDGKPFRGLAMMMLLGLGAMMVITPSAPIVDRFAYIPEAARGLPVLPPLLLTTAYVWSVVDVIITRKR